MCINLSKSNWLCWYKVSDPDNTHQMHFKCFSNCWVLSLRMQISHCEKATLLFIYLFFWTVDDFSQIRTANAWTHQPIRMIGLNGRLVLFPQQQHRQHRLTSSLSVSLSTEHCLSDEMQINSYTPSSRHPKIRLERERRGRTSSSFSWKNMRTMSAWIHFPSQN